MSSTVEQIKDKLSIEEVVSQYVKLQPSGQNLKARCPFHNEKTPSFMVSPARQTYHCFGCGVGGDIFSFVEAIEGVDFKGAMKILADKAGVEIVYERGSKAKSDEREILFNILESATTFFTANLQGNKKAQAYLTKRGLSEQSIASFRIGFANDSWDDLMKHLQAKGYSEEHIERAGLIKSSNKGEGYYDRFRSRIMFPIADSAGRVVAFSGRIFGTDDKETAKYINSPETPLYNKSKILYGYDRAKQSIRRNDFAILVEGQMDLVASHQAGYGNTVAISGTALTSEHVVLLSRMSKNLVLALDADEAGLASATKSARLALLSGFDVKVAAIPVGDDPADIISGNGGEEEWKRIVRASKHIIEFLLDVYRERYDDERKFKLMAERDIVPYIALLQSPIDTEHFTKYIADRLGVSVESVTVAAAKVQREPSLASDAADTNKTKQSSGTSNDTFTERLLAIYKWKGDEQLASKLKAELGEDVFATGLAELAHRDELIFALEELYEDDKTLAADVEDYLLQLRKHMLEHKLREATTEMRKAESTGDEAQVQHYLQECSAIHKQLAKL